MPFHQNGLQVKNSVACVIARITAEMRFNRLTFVRVSSDLFEVDFPHSQLLWCLKNSIFYLFWFVTEKYE